MVKDFNEILHTNPDSADFHYKLGSIFNRQGKLELAIKHYSEALRVKADYLKARFELTASTDNKKPAEEVKNRLQLYEARQPYREILSESNDILP